MWARSLVIALCLLSSPTRAANCSLGLSATSKVEWIVSCADATATGPPSKFDPALLTAVRIGAYDVVEFKPLTAPQPVEVHVPTTFSKLGPLISPTLTDFKMTRDATVRAKVAVDVHAKAFAQMTALQTLTLGFFNMTVDGALELPPSLNEITINHAGLVDFKVTAVKGAVLNVTNIDLRYNNLRRIPLIVLASRRLVFANLFENDFPALRMSRRKVRRLLRLIAAKRILLGAIADYTESCDDGEKKTIQQAGSSYLICQIEEEDDDDLVVDDDEGSGSASSSTTTDAPSSTPTASASSSSSSASASVTKSPSSSPAPSTSAASGRVAFTGLATALLVFTLAHFA